MLANIHKTKYGNKNISLEYLFFVDQKFYFSNNRS